MNRKDTRKENERGEEAHKVTNSHRGTRPQIYRWTDGQVEANSHTHQHRETWTHSHKERERDTWSHTRGKKRNRKWPKLHSGKENKRSKEPEEEK